MDDSEISRQIEREAIEGHRCRFCHSIKIVDQTFYRANPTYGCEQCNVYSKITPHPERRNMSYVVREALDAAAQEVIALENEEFRIKRNTPLLVDLSKEPLFFGKDKWWDEQLARPEVRAYTEKLDEIERRKKMAIGFLALAHSQRYSE